MYMIGLLPRGELGSVTMNAIKDVNKRLANAYQKFYISPHGISHGNFKNEKEFSLERFQDR